MAGNRTGLHREISAIFEGVPLPKDDGSAQRPALRDLHPPRPPAPQPQTLTVSEPPQPVQQLPRPAPDKLPKGPPAIQKTKTRPRQQPPRGAPETLLAPAPRASRAKQKVELISVVVLVVVLSFLLLRPLGTPSQNIADSSETQPAVAQLTTDPDIEIDWQVPPVYPAGLRDPMMKPSSPPRSEATETRRLVVRGIAHDNDEPYAIIGTQIVQEGEKVLGASVIKINQDSVEFEMNGRKWSQKVEAPDDNEQK